MNIRIGLGLAFILFSPLTAHAAAVPLAGTATAPTVGNVDLGKASAPRILPGFDGAKIQGYHYWPFDTVSVLLGPIGPGGSVATASGKKTVIGAHTLLIYAAPDNTRQADVIAYYEALVQKAGGGGVAWSCGNTSCGTGGASLANACLAVAKWYYPDRIRNIVTATIGNGKGRTARIGFIDPPSECQFFVGYIPATASDGDIYVSVYVDNDHGEVSMLVDVVEASNFKVKKIHLDADKMAADLSATGKVDIYGIHFDTNKSNIKPGSTEALTQIAKLLQANPGLDVLIVGHTDNQGDFTYNIVLSKRRAEAVVQALVNTYHIAPSRMKPYGDGMTAPIATNGTKTGRARNRRVELVKQ